MEKKKKKTDKRRGLGLMMALAPPQKQIERETIGN